MIQIAPLERVGRGDAYETRIQLSFSILRRVGKNLIFSLFSNLNFIFTVFAPRADQQKRAKEVDSRFFAILVVNV